MKALRHLWMTLIANGLLAAAALADIRVLLIEGESNHDWEARIEILESILSKDGSFSLDVTITPAAAGEPGWDTWRPAFSDYDVVISGYRSTAAVSPWPAEVRVAFESYVAGGGGFLAFHEANQSFPEWPEYQTMLGLGWSNQVTGWNSELEGLTVRITGEGAAEWYHPINEPVELPVPGSFYTGHGPNSDVLVKSRQNHPIHTGLPAEWMAAELEVVRFPRSASTEVPADVTVLSYATDAIPPAGQAPLDWPVEWTVDYGAGRVYGSTYGHILASGPEPVGLRCAAFQETFLRALKWCAGVDPGTAVPTDFPGVETPSLRPHTEGFAGFGGPVAVGPYADGVLPDSSIVPTGVEIVPAFPNLAWESPIDLRPWPGSPGNLLIAEMDGRLFKVADDDQADTRALVLDIQDRAWHLNWSIGQPQTKHGGILSTVFHPRFGLGEGKDHVYIYYLHNPVDDDSDAGYPLKFYNRLSRFTWDQTAGVFDVASELVLIEQFDSVKGHEGGGMVFGGDGYLYIAVGDEGSGIEDAVNHTQRIDDRFRSGVWRIDVDTDGVPVNQPVDNNPDFPSTTKGYSIPADNPWVGLGGNTLEEFYAIGLREPHRMSYDPVCDRFWIADVGASAREEINVMEGPGLNFGWNYREGTIAGFGSAPEPLIGIETDPVHDYGHDIGNCIIGGYVYRGSAIPELIGKYVFGDNGTQVVSALEYDEATGTTVGVETLGTAREGVIWTGISSFGFGHTGELFVLQLGAGVAGGGLISRIQPAGESSDLTWEYPPTLGETGLFTDMESLTPVPGLIPYEVNSPLWSAGMKKRRWIMVPNDGNPDTPDEKLGYSENFAWSFPLGTVFVKHFERSDDGGKQETRLMVHGVDGWGGVTYKWRADGSDADVLEDGLTEEITMEGETFNYLYPSRAQCRLCHTTAAGEVLGFQTRQLNRSMPYPGGSTANQVESFSAAGFLDQVVKEEDLDEVVTAAPLDAAGVAAAHRIRSYLDSNCAHCHQPGASSRAYFDARLTTPLTNQSIICGPVIESLGIENPAVVKPGSLESSVMFKRMNSMDESCMMPPIAKGRLDMESVVELASWILGMTPDSCSGAQSFLAGGGLGDAAPVVGGLPDDSWLTNIVIDQDATFTNTGTDSLTLGLDVFRYQALIAAEPLTPFVVRVDGPGSFTVLAIGSTRTSHAVGYNEVAFSDSPVALEIAPGEKIAAGFMDTFPDGSGGMAGTLVPWTPGGAEVWRGGGLDEIDAGSLALGAAPNPGGNLVTGEFRDYRFGIRYSLASAEFGDPANPGGFIQVDGASTNFVVNLTDTYTNQSGAGQSVGIERFRFHAERAGEPVTPFVVKLDGSGGMTVVAIGTPRTGYALGDNDLPFAESRPLIELAAGETIAMGFMDTFPDGTGGTDGGVVSFTDGGDNLFYAYTLDQQRGSSISTGDPPVIRGSQPAGIQRDYHFSIVLGLGEAVGDASPVAGAPGSDPRASNIVVSNEALHTNTGLAPVTLSLGKFRYQALLESGPLTPFVVRVAGPGDFTVAAIGTTRTVHQLGSNEVPFSESGAQVGVAPGESVAIGFLNVFDGGVHGELVPWTHGGSVWHGGAYSEAGVGSLVLGEAPDPGAEAAVERSRSYRFEIRYAVTAVELGNPPNLAASLFTDTARSNFVINLDDSFTNNSADPMTVSIDRFRFHAGATGDPLTPFVVRLAADDGVTVIAIGTTRTSYAPGENDVPFSQGGTLIRIEPGETVAVGFMDSFPDGSGGTRPGVVSFTSGGDNILYQYDIIDSGSAIEAGQPPLLRGYSIEDLQRDYYFSITLGFGGEADEDGNGLRDSWELAYFPSFRTPDLVRCGTR